MSRRTRQLVFFAILLLALIAAAWATPMVLGSYFEPVLERVLTNLFGMEVRMQDLHVRPFPGHVHARRLVFENQPQFDRRAHFEAEEIEFRIEFSKLLEKKVVIDGLVLKKLIYYIERENIPEGPRTNVSMWWRRIQEKRKARPKTKKKRWDVTIRRMDLVDSAFIYQDESKPDILKRYVFSRINGFVSDFHWPAEDPTLLEQTVKLRGLFGEEDPTPFWIKGQANFATGKVGFDLKGRIRDGSLVSQRQMFQEIPVDILGGRYDFKIRAQSELRKLNVENDLILKDMKVKMRPNAAGFISGIPVKTWVLIVEDEKRIHLKIYVRGDIADPDFQYNEAFKKAFQEALMQKIQSGFGQVKNSAVKLANQAQGLVMETPGKVINGLGKITNSVSEGNGEKTAVDIKGDSA